MIFKKHFGFLRRWIYLETVLGIHVFVFLLSSILYFPGSTLLYISVAVVLSASAFPVIRKVRKLGIHRLTRKPETVNVFLFYNTILTVIRLFARI